MAVKQYVVCISASNAKVYGKPILDGKQVVVVVEGAGQEQVAKLNEALERFKELDHDDVMVISGPPLVEQPAAYEAKRIKEIRGA